MKTIDNKIIQVQDHSTHYFDLIKACVENAPQGGFGVADMRDRMKVLDAMGDNKEKFDIEDAEFTRLKSCVADMKWAVFAPEIISFCDYIEAIK